MNTPIEIKPEAEKLYEWLLDRTRLLNEPLSKTYVQQNAPNSMRRIEKLNPLLRYLEEKKKINCRPIGLKHYVFLTDDVPESMQFPVVSNQRLNGEINNIEKLELIARISVLERQYKELNDRMLSFMAGFNVRASLEAVETKTTQGSLEENETKDSSNEQKKIRKHEMFPSKEYLDQIGKSSTSTTNSLTEHPMPNSALIQDVNILFIQNVNTLFLVIQGRGQCIDANEIANYDEQICDLFFAVERELALHTESALRELAHSGYKASVNYIPIPDAAPLCTRMFQIGKDGRNLSFVFYDSCPVRA